MRGDGDVEDVDRDGPPKDERVVGDDDDFPLREGSSPGRIAPPEGKSAPAQVPPRGGGGSSSKSSTFFQVKRPYVLEDGHQRWVEEATTHQVAPHSWLLDPIFLK